MQHGRRVGWVQRTLSASLTICMLAAGFVAALPAEAADAPAPPAPDGKIVYEVRLGPETGYLSEIWIAESDGSAAHRLTSGFYDHDPQWSPHGTTIAFTREYPVDIAPDNIKSQVLVMAATGGSPGPSAFPPPGDFFDLTERLISWTQDGGGLIFRRAWRDASTVPATAHDGVFTNGGAVPATTGFALPDAVSSPHCTTPSPGVAPERVSAVPHPDPNDHRLLIQSASRCNQPAQPFREARMGTYGTSGATSLVPVTYPRNALQVDEFTATDWSTDGTEIYDGGLWAAPAGGGTARGLDPDMFFKPGVVPALGCQVAVGKAVTWSNGDGSWAPAGDMIAASMGAFSYVELGSGPATGTWCTPEQTPPSSSIWKIDPTGTTAPSLLIAAKRNQEELVEPDVQCRVGSCLTILRAVANGPIGSTYTFTGDVSGATTPVDPFGQGGVVSKRVTAGQRSITAVVPSGQALTAITCGGSYTANLSTRSVIVSVASGAIVDCTFVFEGTAVDDRDGDGIANDDDSCPDAAGPASTRGCPDRDGDGVPDTTDACDDDPGPVDNAGCPVVGHDADGDGISDVVETAAQSDPNDAGDKPVGASLLKDPMAVEAPEVDCGLEGSINTCDLEPGDVVVWKYRKEGDFESGLGWTYFTHSVLVVGRIDIDDTRRDTRRNTANESSLDVVVSDISTVGPGKDMQLRKFGVGDEGSLEPDAMGVARPPLSRATRKAAAVNALGILIGNGVNVGVNRQLPHPDNQLYAFMASYTLKPAAFGPSEFYCSSYIGRAYGIVDTNRLTAVFYGPAAYFTPDDLLEALGVGDSDWLPGSRDVIGRAFAVFSPAHLLVTDAAGRRTGLGPDGVRHDEIPAALWRLTDQNESVAFPDTDLTGWTFTLSGYNAGKYWFVTRRTSDPSGGKTVAVPGWTRAGLVETFSFSQLPQLQTRPVAVDDAANAVAGTPVTIDVLANDKTYGTGAHLDPATLMLTAMPLHGSASVSNGRVAYTADRSFTGTDSLTYRVCDSAGHCTQAVVTINVAAPACAAIGTFTRVRGSGKVQGVTFAIDLARVRILRADVWVGVVTLTDSSKRVLFSSLIVSGSAPLRADPASCGSIIGSVTGIDAQRHARSLSIRIVDRPAGQSDGLSLTLGASSWSGPATGNYTIS